MPTSHETTDFMNLVTNRNAVLPIPSLANISEAVHFNDPQDGVNRLSGDR
jgi:hypothetical protein